MILKIFGKVLYVQMVDKVCCVIAVEIVVSEL